METAQRSQTALHYGCWIFARMPQVSGERPGAPKNAGCCLRQGSADVGVSRVLRERGMHDEDHIILGLKAGDDGPVRGLVVDRLLVDLGDDGSLAEVDLVGEGAGTDAGDDDAL